MNIEELLTRWTVRLSLMLYAAALGVMILGRHRPDYLREARLAWSVGCVLLWLHLAAAFHFFHDWSHEAAYEATARDTEAVLGWPFGAGVYFNYLFAVVWTVDVVWWWKVGPRAPLDRSIWLKLVVHGFLLFMVFNATVPFGSGGVRWVAAGGFVLLGAVAWRRWRVKGGGPTGR